MRTSQKGLELIKRFEGLLLEAYLDAVGIWTIGYGHTSQAGAPRVVPGMVITEPRAEDILRNDLRKFEYDVESLVDVHLTQHQFDALVSLTFNIGPTNLAGSTLLKRLNEGDYQAARKEFAKWRKAGGVILRGLERRRAAEQDLWDRADAPCPAVTNEEARELRRMGMAELFS